MVPGQCLQPAGPIAVGPGLACGDASQLHQRLVHLVAVTRLRPCLFAHPRDGIGIKGAEIARIGGPGCMPGLHRTRTALLQWRIIHLADR